MASTNFLNPNLIYNQSISVSVSQCNSSKLVYVKPLNCIPPLQQQVSEVDCGIMCECCSGKGWIVCEFCKGEKTNVRSENNRIYRRCPSCRAIGSVLCSKCKVYKCVTFPDHNDGQELNF